MQNERDWNLERSLREYLKGVDGLAGRIAPEIVVLDTCEATTLWSGYAPVAGNEPTITAGATSKRVGTNCIKIAWHNTGLNSAGVLTLAAVLNFAKRNFMGFWLEHDATDNTTMDAEGDITLQFYNGDGTMVGSIALPAFRGNAVQHYVEVALADITLVTGYALNSIKSVRFIKGVTESEDAKSIFIDHIELYDISAGYPVRSGGVIRAFVAAGTCTRGSIAEIAEAPLGTVQDVTDNSETAIGKFCNTVGAGETVYVLVWGLSTLQADEAVTGGEGLSSSSTTDLVDDAAADTGKQYFAKAMEGAGAQYDNFIALIGTHGLTYAA